jgi:hypothetical protein
MTLEQISKIIESSPPKSCSLDPIPTWLLKSHLDVLAPVITHIVNESLQQGYFPLSMKKALVKPLLKKATLDKEVMKKKLSTSFEPIFCIKNHREGSYVTDIQFCFAYKVPICIQASSFNGNCPLTCAE